MALPQPAAAAAASDAYLPSTDVALAAAEYGRFREVERDQLAVMARYNLLEEWSDDARAVVVEARERIQETCAARQHFRRHVRDSVMELRNARESLPAVLRHLRKMIEFFEMSGIIEQDGGWLEAEVLEWAMEEYSAAH
ncbi:MAG: hypothetical protein ACHQWU_03415 [Gemmatimonadales bacterium]